MLETGTSGLMSGEGKPPVAIRSRSRALPRLYAMRQVLCFQLADVSRAFLIQGEIRLAGKQGPGARERNEPPVSRIFVRLRHEMRAQALQLSSELRLGR